VARYLLVAFIALTLGCAHTRDPQPVALSLASDSAITCAQIMTEYTSNTESAAAKIKKNDEDDIQDVAVGLLIWPGLADFKNADGIEGNTLLDRNIRLKNMAVERGCNVSAYPKQPEWYD